MPPAKTSLASRSSQTASRKPKARPAAKARAVSAPVTSTISSKGQIVIPAALRRKYRLEEGSTVIFRESDGHLVIEPDRFAAMLALRGTMDPRMEEDLIEERRKEREREDRQR